jgi:threonylcarbamoyladenosine tRNA methylthiotransferase CDKAL1
MKFYIETYGCTANLGNSKEAEAALLEMGHLPASLAEADIIIVNTCAVTEKTERKIKRRLRQIQSQNDRLVIAGCLAAALPCSVKDIKCLKRIGILSGYAAREIADFLHEKPSTAPGLSPTRPSPTRPSSCQHPPIPTQDLCGIVNIAEGCRGGCSYCIVKKARGGLKSRSPDEISEAVQKLLKSGCIEVQLAAQDTAAYGLDIGTTLPELLERITEIPGRFMVRIGMMNPDTAMPILSDLANVLHSPKVYSFLHMPVQSGSDRILQSMGRRYSAGDYQRIVDYIRRSVDDISLITDVIAGYPGETDEDFRQTIDLLRAVQPDKVNVTRYSSRPGTPASQLYDMPDRIKKDRSRELTRLWLEVAAQRNRRYKGSILDALVTEQGRGDTMKARAIMNYTGIVIEGKPALGSTVRVKVTGSNAFYVTGRVLPQ